MRWGEWGARRGMKTWNGTRDREGNGDVQKSKRLWTTFLLFASDRSCGDFPGVFLVRLLFTYVKLCTLPIGNKDDRCCRSEVRKRNRTLKDWSSVLLQPQTEHTWSISITYASLIGSYWRRMADGALCSQRPPDAQNMKERFHKGFLEDRVTNNA